VSIRLVATGSCLPERKLTNRELEKIVETTDAWITARTGIRERGIVAEGEATSDLATRAAERALAMAGWSAGDLDLIALATVTPDMLTPSAATLVHRNLRVGRPIPAFDFSAACTGFVYGIEMLSALLESGRYRRCSWARRRSRASSTTRIAAPARSSATRRARCCSKRLPDNAAGSWRRRSRATASSGT
jgi:3-oxoacyl-[acyl-carrier-protein] synthase-3